MKVRLRVLLLLVAVTGIWIFMTGNVPAQEEAVRAKIGIQMVSGDSMRKAKARDRLRPGDLLRIYVCPEVLSYVYIVHSDLVTATLLNVSTEITGGFSLILPSNSEYYRVDGESERELFTVISSPSELSQLAGLVQYGSLPHELWAEIQNDLAQQGKIELSQHTDKPFALAGNVRGIDGPGEVDPFVDNLPIFSGRGVLIKQYDFSLKK